MVKPFWILTFVSSFFFTFWLMGYLPHVFYSFPVNLMGLLVFGSLYMTGFVFALQEGRKIRKIRRVKTW